MDLTPELIFAIVCAILLALLVIGLGLVWAIIKVKSEPAPAMLTVTLGLLTLVCILGYFVTRDNMLGTLAGVGLGALAGSLTNVLGNRKPEDKEGGPDA